MNLFLLASTVSLLLYIVLILNFYFSWRKGDLFKAGNECSQAFITIVIPFFNESENLDSLIRNIREQSYPDEKYELILVNDHSTDDSLNRVRDLISTDMNIKLINNTGPPGKKYALREGVLTSRSDFIIISDADCYLPRDWVAIHGAFFSGNPDVAMVSSGVCIRNPGTFVQRYQALEFASLVVTGAASFFQNDPIMCNAANLAFKKDLFLEAFEHIHPDVNTGDDMFLMLYAKKNKRKMHFLKNTDSFTLTSAPGSLKTLFNQRLRWASKANFYRDPKLIYTSVLVLLTNFFTLALFLVGLFIPQILPVFLLFLAIKSFPDYLILNSFLDFTNQKGVMKFFLPSQLINLLFIPLSGITGILIPPGRGRKV